MFSTRYHDMTIKSTKESKHSLTKSHWCTAPVIQPEDGEKSVHSARNMGRAVVP